MNFGAGEAEALSLLWDLKALALPLHDVVVADHALVNEAADAVEVVRGRAPCSLAFTRTAGEAAVVVGHKDSQHGVGGSQIAGLSQAKFTAQTILQYAPEPFDAALGLGTAGGDEGDAELFKSAAELSGLTFSGELFFDGPEVVVAHEDAAMITVKGERDAVAAQQLAEQREIAGGGFGREELGGKDFTGGIVLQAERGEARAAPFEPVVRGAIELDQLALASGRQAALAMSRSPAFARRTDAGLAQESAQDFAAEGETLDLTKFFAEGGIVEAGVGGTGEMKGGLPHLSRQTAGAGASAVGVRPSRPPP